MVAVLVGKWFEQVKAGDKLRPHPDWNKWERPGYQMPDPVEVLRVRTKASSQSGVVFTVQTMNGRHYDLDAAWFLEPESK